MREKISLSKRIEGYLLRKGDWVHKSVIEELAKQAGYLADNASRRCREMESGKLSNGRTCPIVLEKKQERGSVWYRHLYTKPEPVAVPRKVMVQIINGIPTAVMT